MSQPEVFLGQDLMRQALAEKSLLVFEEPSGVMYDTSRSQSERNDAFTAIRFGLAGLVLRAWEPTITEACEPYYFGGNIIEHRFKDTEFFQPHDAEIIDYRNSDRFEPVTEVTQGEYALGMIGIDLQQSMSKVLAEADNHAAGVISVSEVLGSIRQYVLQAKELGLTITPDIYQYGRPVLEDFYRANQEQGFNTFGLVEAARNPIRFTSPAITYLMKSFATAKWQQEGRGYDFSAEYTDNYDPRQTKTMLRDIMLHAARASQRNDSNRTVVSSESRVQRFSIQDNRHGEPEVSWPTKHFLPIPRLQEGQAPSDYEVVSNRRRNKCPIGYTEKAGDPMPIRSIYEAITTYLDESNLHDPVNFVAPKTIGTSLRSVS